MRNDFFKHILLSGGSRQNRTELETEVLPYAFNSNGHRLRNYRIYGNTQNIDGKLVGVGDLVTDENDVHFGTYKVSFSIGSLSQNIYLDQPLWKNGDYVDYLDFSEQKVYRRVKYKALTGQEDGWVTSVLYPGNFYLSWNVLNGLFSCPFICNSAQSVSDLSQYIKGTCYSDNTMNIRIMDPGTTAQEWKNYLANRITKNDPLSIVYTTSVQEDINTVLPSVHTPRQTCILSFNTTVQPSKIWIQGNISEIETVSAEPVQTNVQSLQPLSLDENDELEPSDKNKFQTNDISEMPVEDENSIEEILETENLETTGDDENAE